MAVIDIVKYGNSVLDKKCSPVSQFSGLELIIENMFDSMYEAEGIGLAANQIGLNLHLFIIDVPTQMRQMKHMFLLTVKF